MRFSGPRLIASLLIAVALVAAVKLRSRPESPTPETPVPAPSARDPASVAQGQVSLLRGASTPPSVNPGQPSSPGGARAPAALRSPAEIFTELFRQGTWAAHAGGHGQTGSLRGTPIPGAVSSPESALATARAAARELGVRPGQLSQEHAKVDTDSGLQAMYQYPQWIEGYEVFGAKLTLLARRSDSAVYLMNTTLKPLDQAPSSQGTISRDEAAGIIATFYAPRGGKVVAPVVSNALIFAERSPAELAWLFYVSVTSPTMTKLKVLVGASTKQIVFEAPAIVTN